MKTRYLPADSRGRADYGWLQANYSFSFANYYHPDRIQFGMLRVLNDDVVAPAMGFGKHPHDNMEIVTIPLEGAVRHRDSMGNEGVIRFGEVQVMSAGSGVEHSEMNASHHEPMKTLQIWVFSQFRDVEPRYDQKSFDLESRIDNFITVVSPHDKVEDGSLWIYQQSYFNLGIFSDGATASYQVRIYGNGVYIFLIDGEIEVDGHVLRNRDAMEITDAETIDMKVRSASKILVIEVPM